MYQQTIKTARLLLPVLAATLLFSACKKDEKTTEENITKIVVHLTGTNFDKEFEWEDSDGDGGNAPVIDTIRIPENTTLNCHIHVYDGSQTPVVDLTEEIEAENTEHLFRILSPLSSLLFTNLSLDDNGLPFGLESVWKTGSPASGAVQILLYHEPTDKTKSDPGGEVDFDITFPVVVE